MNTQNAISQRALAAIGGGCGLLLLSVLGFVFANWFWGLVMVLLAILYAAQLWAGVDILEDPARAPVRIWQQVKVLAPPGRSATGIDYATVMARQRVAGLIAPGPQHSPGMVPPEAMPPQAPQPPAPPYPQPPQYPQQQQYPQ